MALILLKGRTDKPISIGLSVGEVSDVKEENWMVCSSAVEPAGNWMLAARDTTR